LIEQSSWVLFMSSLHDFLSCFLVMTFYQSQMIFMFSQHDLKLSIKWSSCFSSCFSSWFLFMILLHDSSSWLLIKWSSCFLIMTLYYDFLSWLFIMTFYHDFLSWLFFMILYHIVFMFLVMTFYQKDNAKR